MTSPAYPLDVSGGARVTGALAGVGPGASPSAGQYAVAGGPVVKQQAWDAAGATHTLAYATYCVGDNSSGTLFISATSKGNPGKNAVATVAFIKSVGATTQIFVVSMLKSTNLTTCAVSTNNNDIVVTTDSDCSVCWTAISAF